MKRLPLLAVRDVVLFPNMTMPLSAGREKSIRALEAAAASQDKRVLVVAQKDASTEDPSPADLFEVGVVAEAAQCVRMPDATVKVFLQGLFRAKLVEPAIDPVAGFWEAGAQPLEEVSPRNAEITALMRHIFEIYERYARLSRRVNPESVPPLARLEDPSRLADAVAAGALTRVSDKQALLEVLDAGERLQKLAIFLNGEIDILNVERKIHAQVRSQIEKNQKEYYLTEQMKAIQKELRQKDDFAKEIDELRKKIEEARMPKAAAEASLKEVARLEKMMPFSPESTVSRSYLDWMAHLPWSKETQDNLDIEHAAKILEEDHYGLQKAKDRILEYLAVCKLTNKLKGPILCFVGPPGVGKTSLASSIARAVGRKFVRMSLGGMRDEAEIRGHRRTYIGSLPGRIIQCLRKAQSRNPVFLLDEVDKMGTDWRGDPAAALLEVLDPEQNNTFTDHYLDVEFDLSRVLFICTANTLDGIPVPLQDRVETIRFPGYTHREKIAIAKGYLIPKQLREHGLEAGSVEIAESALDRTIQEYAREAGVRNLEREIAAMCRKAAKERVAGNPSRKIVVDAENLPKFLGIPKYTQESASYNDVGVATGLAWTEHGGEVLAIEAVMGPGKGSILLTGKLGSIMQESAHAALSFVKANSRSLGVLPSVFKKRDFHVHVPEGATPKDGPSAGAAIAAALASLVSRRAVRPALAMTGEITLTGRVLPIGGFKEKVMAAFREGVKTVLYPHGNRKDLEDIPQDIQDQIRLIPVQTLTEALDKALLPAPAKSARKPTLWKPPVPLPPLRAHIHDQPRA